MSVAAVRRGKHARRAGASARRSRTNSASSASDGLRLNSSSARQVSRTDLGGLDGAVGGVRGDVLAQVVEPVCVHDRLVRSGCDDHEIAVPRLEALERREQLVALRAALRALHALLRVARREIQACRRPPARCSRASSALAAAASRSTLAASPGSRPSAVDRARGGDELVASAAASGSRSRRARSSRPPDARARTRGPPPRFAPAPGTRSTPGPRASESRVNGMSWQRDRIVGGSGPSSPATRTMTAYGGRLLEILEQRVGGVLVHPVRVEDRGRRADRPRTAACAGRGGAR